MKTIIVAGDVVRDYNLVRDPRVPAHHHEMAPHTLLHERAGGAWYLRDLVELACSDLQSRILSPARGGGARKAYMIWSLHPNAVGDKARAWRVEQFLGCEPMTPTHHPMTLPGEEEVGDPDVLVLDDLALDFRAQEELWPQVLRRAAGRPGIIVLKTGAPLGEGVLWNALIERHADRLTLVLSVSALRARPAAISESLSWDLTIEETVREIETGASALDLGRCRRVVVQFGGVGAASFSRRGGGDGRAEKGARSAPAGRQRAVFERFLYHPEELEGSWNARQPGMTFGALSLLTAAIVRHEADPATYPLYIALGRGLAAVRKNHEIGGGSETFEADKAHENIQRAFHPRADGNGKIQEPASIHCTAFAHALLSDPVLRRQSAGKSDLIRDLTGVGLEYTAAKATDVVLRGPREALGPAPKASYGSYLTVDRQEIEQINAIRSLIVSYQQNPHDRRPLSFAVFGAPGSGKSFAIKQLAGELFKDSKATLEFKLAEFKTVSDLHTAFHQVRDASLQGQIPLVFWDEFDAGGLRWLEDFLAPMQDAEFKEGAIVHHLGKAIFVFAGGTSFDFESFDRTEHPTRTVREEFKKVKGPDFVGRLRHSINIKGPNPVTGPPAGEDPAYLIRRAIMLRVTIERHFPHLIDPRTRAASISTSVIRGFLRVKKYLHGARSLEMVVISSSLADASHFGPAALPSDEVLRRHVTVDFRKQVAEGELEVPVIEALAEACHSAWHDERYADGWRNGAVRDDAKKLHLMMRPYAELAESQKESNRLTARLTNAKLLEVGYRISRRRAGDRRTRAGTGFAGNDPLKLMEIEHDIWLRDHLLRGYEWAPETNESLHLHPDIVPFKEVPRQDKRLDTAIVARIPGTLWEKGYTLEKAR